jgi:hypothetical protein
VDFKKEKLVYSSCRSQSYETFCLSYASFSMHKLERRILRQNLRQKMSFGVILSHENSFIGLK